MNSRLTGPLTYLAAIVTAAMLVFILAPLVGMAAISVDTSRFAAVPTVLVAIVLAVNIFSYRALSRRRAVVAR